jgi:hypothetical protein
VYGSVAAKAIPQKSSGVKKSVKVKIFFILKLYTNVTADSLEEFGHVLEAEGYV